MTDNQAPTRDAGTPRGLRAYVGGFGALLCAAAIAVSSDTAQRVLPDIMGAVGTLMIVAYFFTREIGSTAPNLRERWLFIVLGAASSTALWTLFTRS